MKSLKDKMKSEVMKLFPTPVVKIPFGRDFTKKELQLFLIDIPMHKVHKDRKRMLNHQSKDLYLFDGFEKELKDIKKFCEHQLKNYLENIVGANTDLAGLRITQSWLNKTKPGESHHLHHHTNSYLSAVLYICCLPNDHINLSNRSYGIYNNMEFPTKKNTIWNSMGAKVEVKEGDLIIFPSWVNHDVDVNETKNRERISLAFNTFPIGEMGEYCGSHLKL